MNCLHYAPSLSRLEIMTGALPAGNGSFRANIAEINPVRYSAITVELEYEVHGYNRVYPYESC